MKGTQGEMSSREDWPVSLSHVQAIQQPCIKWLDPSLFLIFRPSWASKTYVSLVQILGTVKIQKCSIKHLISNHHIFVKRSRNIW